MKNANNQIFLGLRQSDIIAKTWRKINQKK